LSNVSGGSLINRLKRNGQELRSVLKRKDESRRKETHDQRETLSSEFSEW
jgi:hypothetical protein